MTPALFLGNKLDLNIDPNNPPGPPDAPFAAGAAGAAPEFTTVAPFAAAAADAFAFFSAFSANFAASSFIILGFAPVATDPDSIDARGGNPTLASVAFSAACVGGFIPGGIGGAGGFIPGGIGGAGGGGASPLDADATTDAAGAAAAADGAAAGAAAAAAGAAAGAAGAAAAGAGIGAAAATVAAGAAPDTAATVAATGLTLGAGIGGLGRETSLIVFATLLFVPLFVRLLFFIVVVCGPFGKIRLILAVLRAAIKVAFCDRWLSR